jgi:hypothetical protein
MIKKILKLGVILILILVIFVFYLSYFGIETKRFNQLIKDEISKSNKGIDIELNKVKIILNLKNLSVGLKTYDPKIIFKDKKIKLKKIKTNFSIESFLNKDFVVENLFISTEENTISNIISLARLYENNLQMIIFDKLIKDGSLNADINLNFDEKGKIKNNYKIKGSVTNTKLNLINNQLIRNISFDFEIEKKLHKYNNAKIEFENLKLSSNSIKIINNNNYFLLEGDIKNSNTFISPELLFLLFKTNIKDLGISNLYLSSNSTFYFKSSGPLQDILKFDKKFKFTETKIKSNINLNKSKYKLDSLILKNFFNNYNGFVELENHIIDLELNKKGFSIKGKGKFIIDKKSDKIDYNVSFNNGNYNFKSAIQLKKNPLKLEILNYEKGEGDNSILNIEGSYNKNKSTNFKNILFEESKNKFLIKNLNLSNNFKIKDVGHLELDFINENKKLSKITLKKNKTNYEINAKTFDGSTLLDKMLTNDNKNGISNYLYNFSSVLKINIDQLYTDNVFYLNSFRGNMKFEKNNIVNLNLEGNFNNNKKLTFIIKTSKNDEKITTIFSEYAKPLAKKYTFIKGFDNGVLDFYSIKKNNTSKSQLRIYDFKLKEVPVLTKILTLASLQGIADLLTGEGIRFNEFEMNFNNKDTLMTIDEIYAIGPAISILMSGYIENKKLVSLRGTLVPATTLNKVIGSLPLIGNILVGKKTGEGVFGVSFKIKGPPKDLKTTVNPIKTLTPRFITRTLEKFKNQ